MTIAGINTVGLLQALNTLIEFPATSSFTGAEVPGLHA
jgi:hypothetical protein